MRTRNRLIANASGLTAVLTLWGCDGPSGPPDTTAPAAIVDLAVSRTTSASVTLSWTAPGDDAATGRAARYLVRYWIAPESAFVWDTATPVPASAIPAPATPGTLQECTITGLTPYRLVYCAVRTVDEAGNLATLSNRIVTAAEPPVAESESDVVHKLGLAYQELDPHHLDSLLHPDFVFRLNAPADDGTEFWGAAEEIRVHHRMFRPAEVPVGRPPIPAQLWLTAIDLRMTVSTPFEPRPQYYADPVHNPGGLDPAHWEVQGADYNAAIFFFTQGDTDFRVEGRADFVVANDLTKSAGDPGKFLLYRWTDLGSFVQLASQQTTWSQVKKLYW